MLPANLKPPKRSPNSWQEKRPPTPPSAFRSSTGTESAELPAGCLRSSKKRGLKCSSSATPAEKDYGVTTIITSSGSDHGQAIIEKLGFGVVISGDVDRRYDVIVIVGSDAA